MDQSKRQSILPCFRIFEEASFCQDRILSTGDQHQLKGGPTIKTIKTNILTLVTRPKVPRPLPQLVQGRHSNRQPLNHSTFGSVLLSFCFSCRCCWCLLSRHAVNIKIHGWEDCAQMSWATLRYEPQTEAQDQTSRSWNERNLQRWNLQRNLATLWASLRSLP